MYDTGIGEPGDRVAVSTAWLTRVALTGCDPRVVAW
jgi:hypothetical protein